MDIILLCEEEAVQLQTFFLKHGLKEPFAKQQDAFVFSLPDKEYYMDMLAYFIIHVKRGEFLHKILSKKFYYENEEECEQIIEIVSEMCSGKREELTALAGKINEFELVRNAVGSLLDSSTSVLFDSLWTFRLKKYQETLIRYLHVAIDEYKMEQEYQMFINMLREYLKDRTPIKKMVHLLIDDEITFYDEHFHAMEKKQVIDMVDRRLLAIHPVYIDSAVIAPLLSMAPEKIILYTPYEEKPLVRTLVNIFEERMVILPPVQKTK
ncbi:putative sporulation protein YtxC [Siminovitchia fortis]|uniref:putative sporulation protein YtxC n=1 Tax=Siminovitchia fortis TaxID=254758 RepID=UPI001642C483|nr:putative sporulation protein YtxC [Siminovitchia fortis]